MRTDAFTSGEKPVKVSWPDDRVDATALNIDHLRPADPAETSACNKKNPL